MRRLLGFLLLTALVVAGAVWLADRPGEVMIRWQGWRVDTNVPVLLGGLVLLMVVVAMVLRLLRLVFGAPRRVLAARRGARTRKGYAALSDGMAAVAAGDPRRAVRLAKKADKLLRNPAVTGLLSVQAARLSGGEPGKLRLGYEAMAGREETAFIAHRGLMDLALAAGDRATALAEGGQAFALQPGAEGLAAQLFDLQLEAGKLAEAELTLSAARRHDALPLSELDRRRAVVLFARAQAARAEGDGSRALTLALEAQDRYPTLAPAAVLAAELQVERGKARRAASVLLSAFRAAPHPELVTAWAALGPAEPPLERVKHMQRLSEANTESPEGHVALAEAALAAKLWGQARSHLDKALAVRKSAGACRLMAALERGEHKDEAAAVAWDTQALTAPADPAWTCTACGEKAGSFTMLCPACRAPGTLEWRI